MWWLSLIILTLAIPVGYWVAWLARDELVVGRRWFGLLMFLGALAALVFLIVEKYAAAGTSAFIAILAFVSYWKSLDRTWTRAKKVSKRAV